MTAKSLLLLIFVGCLSQSVAVEAAQNDSLTFNQGRLRIWCETARFVYEDNGADSLLPSLNCQSLETLKNSMASTDGSLGVMRLMNTIDKPAVYKGFSTTEAKLQKLANEISSRLKQSSVRRTNPARLNRVDSLQQQLLLVARQVGAQAAEVNEGAKPAAPVASGEPAAVPTAAIAETESDIPWNEVLQWLTLLLLAGLLFWRLRELEQRYSRLKREFRSLEKQVNEFMIATINPGPLSTASDGLSAKEVRNVVKEELRQNRPAAPKTTAPPTETAESPVQPVPIPATVHVPAPALAQAPAATHVRQESDNGLYYDKLPYRGGFHQNEMSRERQRDSLYTIRVYQDQPNEGEYWITEDSEVQRYAMQNGLSFFEEGCEFTEVDENPGRVVNEQKGRLRKEGGVWKIYQKAKVRFE